MNEENKPAGAAYGDFSYYQSVRDKMEAALAKIKEGK